MADVVILPVVRIAREAVARPDVLPAPVTDINAFRYWRERAAQERRERTSLLPHDAEQA